MKLNKINRLWLLLLSLAVFASAFSGCGTDLMDLTSDASATGEFPVTVGDVEIPSKPTKVVCLSASLADVSLALGCETQFVAATSECTQPELEILQKIDPTDTQTIISLSPDLVIDDAFDAATLSALSDANIKTLAISPATTREDFERLYSQLSSALLGGGAGYDKGVTTAQEIFTTLDDIERTIKSDTVITACYLFDTTSSAVTGDMFGSVLMEYSGMTNIFKSQSGGVYDVKTLKIGNPTVIFCPPGLRASVMNNSDFSTLSAVQSGKVYELDVSYMYLQGNTVKTAALEMTKAAFPELTERSAPSASNPTSEFETSSSVTSGDGLSSESSESSESSSSQPSVTPSPDELAEYTELTMGNYNSDVLKMQERLAELSYLDMEYDGLYGEATADCVSEFQRNNGLDVTGVADPLTLYTLYSDNAVPKS